VLVALVVQEIHLKLLCGVPVAAAAAIRHMVLLVVQGHMQNQQL
jgi:hypothetical protein